MPNQHKSYRKDVKKLKVQLETLYWILKIFHILILIGFLFLGA